MTSFEWFKSLLPPDQLMCCICFEGKHVSQSHRDERGEYWDICRACYAEEEAELLRRRDAARPPQ